MKHISYALPPDTLLKNGRYELQSVLGAGGFGVTYLAVDKMAGTFENDRLVIKELFIAPNTKNFDCSRDPHDQITVRPSPSLSGKFDDLKKRFRFEAEVLHRFREIAGMVKVRDYFEEHNTVYFGMGYIEGQTLSKLVKDKGALPTQEALDYTLQIAEVLREVHKEKVLHRDVKPENILIDQQSNAYLLDFGISKEYEEVDRISKITGMGTPRYAPPEQIAGKRDLISTGMDVYGLASTLYYCLTGEPPQTAEEVNLDGRKTAKDLVPELPDDLNDAIEQGRIPQPKHRTQTVDAFMAHLQKQAAEEDEDTIPINDDDSPVKDTIPINDDDNPVKDIAPDNNDNNPAVKNALGGDVKVVEVKEPEPHQETPDQGKGKATPPEPVVQPEAPPKKPIPAWVYGLLVLLLGGGLAVILWLQYFPAESKQSAEEAYKEALEADDSTAYANFINEWAGKKGDGDSISYWVEKAQAKLDSLIDLRKENTHTATRKEKEFEKLDNEGETFEGGSTTDTGTAKLREYPDSLTPLLVKNEYQKALEANDSTAYADFIEKWKDKALSKDSVWVQKARLQLDSIANANANPLTSLPERDSNNP